LEIAATTYIFEVLRGLHSRINLLRATSLMDKNRLPQSLAEIAILVQAFGARDARKAAEMASEHVRNASEVALRYLREPAAAGNGVSKA